MKRIFLLVVVTLVWGCASVERVGVEPTVRVAVIGGLMRGGLWPELAKRFEASSDFKVKLVISGNRDLVADWFAEGGIDLAILHEGEVADDLVKEEYARHLRVWAQNDFVIIGPREDPARIRGLRDGGRALQQIARSNSRFVDYQNSGPRDVTSALWKKAGFTPGSNEPWILKTKAESSEEAIAFAREQKAYLVLGRVPRIPEGLEVLVQGDPVMQRRFVIIEANSKRFPKVNIDGAAKLGKFLESGRIRMFMETFATNTAPGFPLFLPVR